MRGAFFILFSVVSVVGGCGERERSSNKGREAWQYCMEHGGQAADVGEKVVGMIDMHAIARIDEST